MVAHRKKDRAMGAFIGLAVGDALGTTVEFKARDSFPPVTNMVGGGPFNLKPGQWTGDTSLWSLNRLSADRPRRLMGVLAFKLP